MIQCNTIAIHSSSFVRSAARSFVHAPSPSPSARARASRLARRLTLMVGRSSPRRRDDYGGGRHNTPVRDARPRTREPVSHRTTSIKNSHRRSASSSTSNRLARVASERIQHRFRSRERPGGLARGSNEPSRTTRARGEDTPTRARRLASARKNTRRARARERRVTRRVVIVTRGRFVENASRHHRHAHQPGSWCGDLRVLDCLPTREWRDESTRARARKQRITQGEGREEK